MNNYSLKALGWNDYWNNEFEGIAGSYDVGRVAVEYRGLYKVYCENKEVLASISGKMQYSAAEREDYPAVGDWVVLDKVTNINDRATIRAILTRRSKFSRKSAGETAEEQIVAVNIDTVFICMSLNQNFNVRRLERYITMAWESGATPVVLLTKADLCEDIEEKLEEARASAIGVDVYSVSCIDNSAVEAIKGYIRPGLTVAFMGSSGVGKSTIVNRLLGEERLDTQEISSTGDRGRHTTTNRELIILPDGGIVIDTPGMREFHILDTEDGISTTFADIESLGQNCKFSDCTHTAEPGCAVLMAIANGDISEDRYHNYIKLLKEAEFIERKTNIKAALEYKNFIKKRGKLINAINRKR